MAEYSEVIKQFKRMCRYTNNSGLPNECPLYCKGHGCNISHCRLLAFEDKKFQNVVMSWATKHPEPVYPTWADWFYEEFLCWCQTEHPGRAKDAEAWFDYLYETHIPADIAQKLRIQPKEE